VEIIDFADLSKPHSYHFDHAASPLLTRISIESTVNRKLTGPSNRPAHSWHACRASASPCTVYARLSSSNCGPQSRLTIRSDKFIRQSSRSRSHSAQRLSHSSASSLALSKAWPMLCQPLGSVASLRLH